MPAKRTPGRPKKRPSEKVLTKAITMTRGVDADLTYLVKHGGYPSRSSAIGELVKRAAANLRRIIAEHGSIEAYHDAEAEKESALDRMDARRRSR